MIHRHVETARRDRERDDLDRSAMHNDLGTCRVLGCLLIIMPGRVFSLLLALDLVFCRPKSRHLLDDRPHNLPSLFSTRFGNTVNLDVRNNQAFEACLGRIRIPTGVGSPSWGPKGQTQETLAAASHRSSFLKLPSNGDIRTLGGPQYSSLKLACLNQPVLLLSSIAQLHARV